MMTRKTTATTARSEKCESQNLFRKMGFAETSTSDVFRERTLSFRVRKDDAGLMNEVETTWAQVSREKYDDEEDNSDNGA